MPHRCKVKQKGSLPLRGFNINKWRLRWRAPGIIHPHIERSIFAQGRIRQPFNSGNVGYIRRAGDCLTSRRIDFIRNSLDFVLPSSCAHHIGAGICEHFRNTLTDAPSSTRHYSRLPGQVEYAHPFVPFAYVENRQACRFNDRSVKHR